MTPRLPWNTQSQKHVPPAEAAALSPGKQLVPPLQQGIWFAALASFGSEKKGGFEISSSRAGTLEASMLQLACLSNEGIS